jgi:4a-hydroxytetrahydrobiopterin dehydratase
MSELLNHRCEPCTAQTPKLTGAELERRLKEVPGYALEGDRIARTYRFGNYYQTMAFVNAVAWIAHREDHHPDLEVFYDRVVVRYSTHAAGGLTLNDFVCAAKVDALILPGSPAEP